MKETGIVRRIDVLGRVVIPKEIRKTLKMNEGDPVEIYTEKSALVIKKYSPVKSLEGSLECAAKSLFKCTGHIALICDAESYVSAAGLNAKDVIGSKIPKAIEELVTSKKTLVANKNDGGTVTDIIVGDKTTFANQLFMPIICDEEAIGGIILADKSKDSPITSSDISLAMLSAEFIAAHF